MMCSAVKWSVSAVLSLMMVSFVFSASPYNWNCEYTGPDADNDYTFTGSGNFLPSDTSFTARNLILKCGVYMPYAAGNSCSVTLSGAVYFTAGLSLVSVENLKSWSGSINMKDNANDYPHSVKFINVGHAYFPEFGIGYYHNNSAIFNNTEADIGLFRLAYDGTVKNSKLTIAEGSVVSITNMNWGNSVPYQDRGYHNVIVTGSGSVLNLPGERSSDPMYTARGGDLFGGATIPVTVTVADGASVNAASVIPGRGGKAWDGTNHNGDNQTLYVTNNATLTLKDWLVVGYRGSNCTAVFENSTLNMAANAWRYIAIGKTASARNNRLRFSGSSMVLNNLYTGTNADMQNHSFFFWEGCDNLLELDDHVILNIPSGGRMFLTASNNTVRATNGAKIHSDAGSLDFGLDGNNIVDERSRSNTLFLGDGCQMDFYRMRISGRDNRFIVSNATVTINATGSPGLLVGSSTVSEGVMVTNNQLIIQGATPSLVCANHGIQIVGDGGGVLRYELTAAGYATEPLSAKTITLEAGSTLEVDPTRYVAALGIERSSLALAKAETSIYVDGEVLAAANAALKAQNSRCSLVVHGNKLVLKVRGEYGTVLILR